MPILYCNRNYASEDIDDSKTSVSMGRVNFHYWYFLHKGFKVQSSVCNSCHDVLMMSFGSDFMGKSRSLENTKNSSDYKNELQKYLL